MLVHKLYSGNVVYVI